MRYRYRQVDIILDEIEFLRDLLVRQIETHQIQTQYPLAQGLMVMGEDRIGQIVKIASASLAAAALTLPLALAQVSVV